MYIDPLFAFMLWMLIKKMENLYSAVGYGKHALSLLTSRKITNAKTFFMALVPAVQNFMYFSNG